MSTSSVTDSQCQKEFLFGQVHEKDFVARFSNGTLNEAEVRRIGFGEVTRHPDLIERTKAEVAGTSASTCVCGDINSTIHHKKHTRNPKPTINPPVDLTVVWSC